MGIYRQIWGSQIIKNFLARPSQSKQKLDEKSQLLGQGTHFGRAMCGHLPFGVRVVYGIELSMVFVHALRTQRIRCTTGLRYFAECHRHSAKVEKHSANCWPSVALGEAHTAFLPPAKPALPSAFSRALGKPLPCAKPHSAKKS